MAEKTEAEAKASKETIKKFDKAGEPAVDRKRKVYDHELTSSERFALQAFQKARNALTALCEHIQEGKGCSAETVTMAIGIQASAAKVLFAE
jgi:hypothetical protein